MTPESFKLRRVHGSLRDIARSCLVKQNGKKKAEVIMIAKNPVKDTLMINHREKPSDRIVNRLHNIKTAVRSAKIDFI